MKNSFNISTILAFLAVSFSTQWAGADAIQLDAKGKQATIALPAGNRAPITAYVLSKGNETQFVTLHVQAPNGTKVTARTMVVGKAKPKDVVNKSAGWSNASFMTYSGSESSTLTVGGTSSRSRARAIMTPIRLAAESEFYCGNATAADIDYAISVFLEIQGVTYTRDQLCALYGYPVDGGGGGGDSDGGYSDGSGDSGGYGGGSVPYGSSTSEAVQILVRKNTCAENSKAVYLVRIDLNFSGVAADTIAQDSEIYISATPIVYRGSKASSVKPTSDGKFAPRALFLMATTGGWGNEKMTLVKWNKNKPSLKTLRIEDMVYWRSHSLARIVAEPVLRGGVGVGEMQSNLGVYSVCFRLSKTRQKYNGYS